MRVTIGTLGALTLAVAVAGGQPPRERAALLKPPVALPAGEGPVARGAEPSPVLGSGTPVEKRAAPGGPAWLTGADPNLLPAGGAATKDGGAKQLTPAPKDGAPNEPSFRDRVKNALPTFGGKGESPPPNPLPDLVTSKKPAPKPAPEPVQPTAATAFKAVSGTGAPVFAGPPAYRWYGWGTVTPGANPVAPAGQYPRTSAAWYAVTGATPGAFPVLVSNTGQPLPGVEPPTYGLARSPAPLTPSGSLAPAAGSVGGAFVPPASQPLVPAQPQPQPESKFQPPPATAFVPPPTFVPPALPAQPALVPTLPPPPVNVPTIAQPGPKPVAVAPPALPPIPNAAAAPPAPDAGALLIPALVPSVAPAAPIVPAGREMVVVPEPEPLPTGPRPLPTTATVRDEANWNRAADPAPPQPGQWLPAGDPAPLPTRAPSEPMWNPGRGAPVIRGQSNDSRADPVAELVKQLCAGRAEGVEVRYVGTKKLVVCFEVRGKAGAEKLVADISARPELTAFQIDFCVVVK